MTVAHSSAAEDAPDPAPVAGGAAPFVDRWESLDAAHWHAGWGLAFAALCGLSLAFWSPSQREVVTLAVMAAPGLLAWPLGRREAGGGLLVFLWTAAAVAAAVLAGGPLRPLGAVALLAPMLAGASGGMPGAGAFATAISILVAGVAALSGLFPAGAPAQDATVAATLAIALVAALAAGAAFARDTLGGPQVLAPGSRAPSGLEKADANLRAELAAAIAERDTARSEARTRASFLANMSHELRTPLNAIVGFSDIMRTKLFGPLSDRYAEYAELIHESGGHLLDLINDVLDLSKIEADKFELRRERMDAREPVNAALRLMRQQADDAGVRLRASLPSDPLVVDADSRALKQIALNLLSNALKFTPRGGEVDLSLGASAGEMELTVADTGVGVSAEDLERLGRPYAQAEAGRAAGGTGLGLSLVKGLTAMHGGRFILESRLGEGAAATVRMPVLTA